LIGGGSGIDRSLVECDNDAHEQQVDDADDEEGRVRQPLMLSIQFARSDIEASGAPGPLVGMPHPRPPGSSALNAVKWTTKFAAPVTIRMQHQFR
jgi:hypothetical protein